MLFQPKKKFTQRFTRKDICFPTKSFKQVTYKFFFLPWIRNGKIPNPNFTKLYKNNLPWPGPFKTFPKTLTTKGVFSKVFKPAVLLVSWPTNFVPTKKAGFSSRFFFFNLLVSVSNFYSKGPVKRPLPLAYIPSPPLYPLTL